MPEAPNQILAKRRHTVIWWGVILREHRGATSHQRSITGVEVRGNRCRFILHPTAMVLSAPGIHGAGLAAMMLQPVGAGTILRTRRFARLPVHYRSRKVSPMVPAGACGVQRCPLAPHANSLSGCNNLQQGLLPLCRRRSMPKL